MDRILKILKADLGIINSTARDEYFIERLTADEADLKGRGIVLDLSAPDDCLLLADYTAWVYRHRESGEPIPKHIELRLNNRKVKTRCNNG